MSTVEAALTRLAREDGGRVLAILARRLGDLDLADDAVQDALLEAVQVWPDRGVPDNPAAWLMTVARRKAVDRLRRTTTARRRALAAAPDLLERDEPADDRGLLGDDMPLEDERLRLILLCCHPALNQDAQVALTLRLVGGLTTAEIGAAFLTPEPTITQRIVRAKRKIRDARIPLGLPDRIDDRLGPLLAVLYLVFNEGYLSRGAGATLRVDLADEAIRLAAVVDALVPDSTEVAGLRATMLYQRARTDARVSALGELVLLEQQDRTRWDRLMIEAADAVLVPVLRAGARGPYAIQAVIASLHAHAPTFADTDWPAIASAYGHLVAVTGSPVARLNRAVAVAMADGPQAGLRLLDEVQGLETYHLFHATSGELHRRAGATDAARAAFTRARDLAVNPAERRLLERRLAELG